MNKYSGGYVGGVQIRIIDRINGSEVWFLQNRMLHPDVQEVKFCQEDRVYALQNPLI